MSDQTPANWVTDPTDPTGARRRYWDGSQWTDWVMLPGAEQPTELSVAEAQAAAAGSTATAAASEAAPADLADAEDPYAHMQSAPTERIDYTPAPGAQPIPYSTVPDSTLDQNGFATEAPEKKKSRTGLILGIVGGIGVFLLLVAVGIGYAANKATDALQDSAQDIADELNDAADELAAATAEPTETATVEPDDTSDDQAAADGSIADAREVAAMSQDEYIAYATSVETSFTATDWDGMFLFLEADSGESLFLGMVDMLSSGSLGDDEALELGYAACDAMTEDVVTDAFAYGTLISEVVEDAGYDALEDYDALVAPSSAYLLCPQWTDVLMSEGLTE